MRNFFILFYLLFPITLLGQGRIGDIPSTSVSKPTIHWLTLSNLETSTEQPSIALHAKTTSTSSISVEVYINGIEIRNYEVVLENPKRRGISSIKANIDLQKGKNEIALHIRNKAGKTIERRYVNYINYQPPTLSWNKPRQNNVNTSEKYFPFELEIKSPTPITNHNIFINDSKIMGTVKEDRERRGMFYRVIVGRANLTKKNNILKAEATNSKGTQESKTKKITYAGTIYSKPTATTIPIPTPSSPVLPPSTTRVPVVVVRPLEFKTTDNPDIAVHYTVADVGGNLSHVKIWHNNQVINQETKGFKKIKGEGDQHFDTKITLVPGDNTIKIIAYTDTGNPSEEKILRVRYQPQETNYYALIIAVEDYPDQDIEDLDFPLEDAQKLEGLLLDKYMFNRDNVKLLSNPKESELEDELANLERLTEKDNLLIFYSGHGYYEEKTGQGYWFPKDAQKNKKSTWIRNSTITDFISAIPAKHTLLISDACFSGSIFAKSKSGSGSQYSKQTDEDMSKIYEQSKKLKSRRAMTSGYLSEVPDKSVFFKFLYDKLKLNNRKYFSAGQLFSQIKEGVMGNTENIPQYEILQSTGHDGGDFIFIKK